MDSVEDRREAEETYRQKKTAALIHQQQHHTKCRTRSIQAFLFRGSLFSLQAAASWKMFFSSGIRYLQAFVVLLSPFGFPLRLQPSTLFYFVWGFGGMFVLFSFFLCLSVCLYQALALASRCVCSHFSFSFGSRQRMKRTIFFSSFYYSFSIFFRVFFGSCDLYEFLPLPSLIRAYVAKLFR